MVTISLISVGTKFLSIRLDLVEVVLYEAEGSLFDLDVFIPCINLCFLVAPSLVCLLVNLSHSL